MAMPMKGSEESISGVLVTVAAEVLLICAVVLVLFVYLQLPTAVATGLSLALFFAGSLFCWKSLSSAQIILVLSLLASEFVVLSYFDYLLLPFIVLDAVAVAALARMWQPKLE